jgi:hypothetical protein
MAVKLSQILFLILLSARLSVFGQIESATGSVSGYEVEDWYDINIEESVIETLSAIRPPKNEAYQFAFPVEVILNPENSGFWKRSGNEMIWTIGVRSKNARSVNLILEPFNLPRGAYVYIYNPEKTVVRGAFGEENNNQSSILATYPVPGDRLILEYHVPDGRDWKGSLGISQVAHDYRGIVDNGTKDGRYNLSQSCNVDINCTDGTGYETEKRSVCRIIIRGTELCTGFLVNNTNQQNRALLITAQHCIVTNDDAVKSLFVFGYESPWCDGPDGRVIHSISGSSLLSTNESIDFSLVELSSFPPYTYKPYLAGWDVTGAIPQKSAVIHHPEGDVMKISTDQNSPVTASFLQYTTNSFWKVLQWETGTTEGGSSGAPLFNQNKRIVGMLSGGLAQCGRSVDDYFLKLSVAYDLSSLLYQQLKGWIDPAVTGLKTFEGRDPYEPNKLTADTIYNVKSGETTELKSYLLPGTGYATGFNSDSIVMYAEYFNNPSGKELSEVLINLGKVASVSATDSVSVYVFADGSVPGAVKARQKVYISEAKDGFHLHVDFKNTVAVGGNFYIGWNLWYKEKASLEPRQFAVLSSPDRIDPSFNSAWFKNGTLWKKFTQHPSYPMSVSLDVKAVMIGNSVLNNVKTIPVKNHSFLIYPVPAGEKINIHSDKNSGSVQVRIFDSRGSLVLARIIHSSFPGTEQLELPGLMNGIYYILIQSDDSAEYHKIVISK